MATMREEDLKALERAKAIERKLQCKGQLVTARIDERTVICAKRKRIKELQELHRERIDKMPGKVVFRS